MKKIVLILIMPLFISGCFDNTDDIKAHMATVHANTTTYIEPMPSAPVFHHFEYSAHTLRSPFVAPQPAVIQEKIQQMSGCLGPEPRRRKQPLEKFALSDLSMKGTLGEAGTVWALVESSDGTLHRVTSGNYVGLFNGIITAVTPDKVKVIELIPDGAGCWVKRETAVVMVRADLKGQRN
ncbi:MAG: pilus assembly protein PilP [Alteromonadaceae bacterium]|nr:pilus assembly protein PilP [Alteromonadaceae bacterium]